MLNENLISPGMIIEVKNSDQRDELIAIVAHHGATAFATFNSFPHCVRIEDSGSCWSWFHQNRRYYERVFSGRHIYEFEELEADDACFDEFSSMWDEMNKE